MKKKLFKRIILCMFVLNVICYIPFNGKEDNTIDLFNVLDSNEL
ncbi:hypothetical protein [Anaerococcus tetradius]|nr:hypothetical protein [Anaerococcus tetradius]